MTNQTSEDYEDVEWSSYADVVLLNSLAGLRPVGINYAFCTMAVWNRFSHAMAKDVSLKQVEKRLAAFYDFEAANGIVDENQPFTNQLDFSLPEVDFPQVATILKDKESAAAAAAAASKKTSNRLSTAELKNLTTSKSLKKAEPKNVDKTRKSSVDEEKKTPGKKRGRGSEKHVSTPVTKKSRI